MFSPRSYKAISILNGVVAVVAAYHGDAIWVLNITMAGVLWWLSGVVAEQEKKDGE